MTYAYVLNSGGINEAVFGSLCKAQAFVSGCGHWHENTRPGEHRWWAGAGDFYHWKIEQFPMNPEAAE